MTKETVIIPTLMVPPVGEFVIRILSPQDLASSIETYNFADLDAAESAARSLQATLYSRGYHEYTFHILNQNTGATVKTFSRVVKEVPYESEITR